MPKGVDMVLKIVATGDLDSVRNTCQVVCEHIDEAVAKLDWSNADYWRRLSRVIDGMAELRFPREWSSISPAQKHDRERSYAAIPEAPAVAAQ